MKTTDEQFQFFINSVKRYCDKLKISGWELRFRHKYIENGFAQVQTDDTNRIAEFTLTDDWNDTVRWPSDEYLDYCVRYEVGRLFLRRVFVLAEDRFAVQSNLDALDEEFAIRIAELIHE